MANCLPVLARQPNWQALSTKNRFLRGSLQEWIISLKLKFLPFWPLMTFF